MRGVIGAAWALAAAPVAAQAPGTALAPGETALHIVAHGEAEAPADRIELPVTASGHAATAAAARAAADATAARLVAALIAAGIDRASIIFTPTAGRVAAAPPPVVAPALPGLARPSLVTQTTVVRVVVPGAALLERAQQVVAEQDQAQAGTPVPRLVADAAAHRAAARDALAHARRDADDYAAAVGLRVGRVVAVSNVAGFGDELDALVREFRDLGNRPKSPDTVVVRVTAAVDYALTPR